MHREKDTQGQRRQPATQSLHQKPSQLAPRSQTSSPWQNRFVVQTTQSGLFCYGSLGRLRFHDNVIFNFLFCNWGRWETQPNFHNCSQKEMFQATKSNRSWNYQNLKMGPLNSGFKGTSCKFFGTVITLKSSNMCCYHQVAFLSVS